MLIVVLRRPALGPRQARAPRGHFQSRAQRLQLQLATSALATVDAVAEWQLDSGMVPWFPGGHADTWNHTESLMALMLGGRRTEAELGFDWLRSVQRPDGSWHQYYLADRVEQDKLDANCCAYVAAGVWFHWLLYRDRGALETMWPMVHSAISFVLELQTHRGEILWAVAIVVEFALLAVLAVATAARG